MQRTQRLENTIACNSVAFLGLAKDLEISTEYVARRYITDKNINTLRTGSFKLFKRSFPGFLTILTL